MESKQSKTRLSLFVTFIREILSIRAAMKILALLLLVGQTGYMKGAAGIGMLLLHIDGFQRGKKAPINFPDSPFD